jgi:hypothetical protein
MRPAQKAKAQTVINKILDGDFGEREVEELFIRLRDESHGIFRDFGDYIAHPGERNQGIAVNQTNAMYCSTKFLDKYQLNKHPFDTDDLPDYFLDYLNYQLEFFEKHKRKELKQKFGDSKKLSKTISGAFEQKNGKISAIRELSENEKLFLQYLTTVYGPHTPYTQKEIISSVVSTVKQCGLNINKDRFYNQGNAFTLCLMCILHETLHTVKGRTKGLCRISYLKAYDNNKTLISEAAKGPDDPSEYELALCLHLNVDLVEGSLSVIIPMLRTTMPILDFCINGDISILYNDNSIVEKKTFQNNKSYLAATKDFKLQCITV